MKYTNYHEKKEDRGLMTEVGNRNFEEGCPIAAKDREELVPGIYLRRHGILLW